MRRRGLLFGVGVALLSAATGCSTMVAGTGEFAALVSNVSNAKVPINGLPGSGPTDVDVDAANAISDIQMFWSEQFPQAFGGKKYEGPQGGFYSVDPSNSVGEVPCVSSPKEIQGNAFYCPKKDIVAWDRIGLFPQLKEQFGSFLIAMVLAHEWGHVIQTKSDVDPSRTIVRETQADCYAGSFTRWALEGQSPHYQIKRSELDNALAGYLLFRDPVGADANDEQAHGNGFDRISAFQEGFEQGVNHCKGFTDERKFTEISFTSSTDQESGGNLPFDGDQGALAFGQQDLDATWPDLFQQTYSKQLSKPQFKITSTGSLDCNGQQLNKAIYFCAQANSVEGDHDGLNKVYTRLKNGDYAPMTLVGIAYAQSVVTQSGLIGADDETNMARAICLDGAYTRTVVDREPKQGQVTLSPGDLDEAMQALLFFAGLDNYFGSPGGMSGFDRVQAYRRGFGDIKSCSTV